MFLWRFARWRLYQYIADNCILYQYNRMKLMSYNQALALNAQPLPPLSRVLVSLALTVAAGSCAIAPESSWHRCRSICCATLACPKAMPRHEAEKPFWRA